MIISTYTADLTHNRINLINLVNAAKGSYKNAFAILKSSGVENVMFPSEPKFEVVKAAFQVFGTSGVSIAGQTTYIDNKELLKQA